MSSAAFRRSPPPPARDEGTPDPALPAAVFKGRGAIGNPDSRHVAWTRVREDDGWQAPAPQIPGKPRSPQSPLRHPAAAARSVPRPMPKGPEAPEFSEATELTAATDGPSSPLTQLVEDHSRSILSHNDSPDLPFDQSLNPYRGCEHGCIYCYARPSHAWLGLSPGLDFETVISHKPEAAALLTEALAKPGYRCRPLALGTNTDAYQPVERRLGLTRRVLEVLRESRHPVTLITKSALVERDLDLLTDLAQDGLVQVMISVTSLDPALARQLEPRAAAPARRLETVSRLSEAGIPVGVMVAPVIPGLTDRDMESILAAARQAGAQDAVYTVLRLPREVGDLFRAWLHHHAPEKSARILALLYDLRRGKLDDGRFGSRMTGLGHYGDLLGQRFALAKRRQAFPGLPALNTELFQAPPAPLPPALPTPQLDLF